MNKYWYVKTIFYCPVCGSEEWIRTRVKEKPPSYFEWVESYDHCDQ